MATKTTSIRFEVEEFDDKGNYSLRLRRFRGLLVKEGLHKALLGEARKPKDMSDPDWKCIDLEDLDLKATCSIGYCLADEVMYNVMDQTYAAELWSRLESLYMTKGLEYEYNAVNLWEKEHFDPEYEKLNPARYVPALVDGDVVVADSFAISLYLEDKYPEHPLLPKDLQKKALNLQVASIVCSSIQPLQMPHVLDSMGDKLTSDDKRAWSRHNVVRGITALEKLLKDSAGKYATGDEPLLADVFLAPQLFVAINRFQIDMSPYPTLARINEAYAQLPAFQAALPGRQPDAPSSS